MSPIVTEQVKRYGEALTMGTEYDSVISISMSSLMDPIWGIGLGRGEAADMPKIILADNHLVWSAAGNAERAALALFSMASTIYPGKHGSR